MYVDKALLAFVHLADRSKSQGFRRSAAAASCGGILKLQPARHARTKPSWPLFRAGVPMPYEPAYADKRSKDCAARSASE